MTAHVIAARRTAVVPRDGAFRALTLEAMAAPVIATLLADVGLEGSAVDEVIVSNALGAGGNPARRVALAAGLPERVAGLTIDRQCAGGLDAILLARALVESGAARVVVAGGVESYSRRPLRLATDPAGGPPRPYDQPPFTPWPERDPGMAEAAAALAVRQGISRADADAWAVESHARARARGQTGEIVEVAGTRADPFTRRLTMALAARAPVLEGRVTVANTAVAADGAAFVLVVSGEMAVGRAHAMRILGGASVGGDPMAPGLAPVAAIGQVLRGAGVAPDTLAAAEIMEAYAVQAMACVAGAGLAGVPVNPGGGALARGHPVGASGAVLAVRLFWDLRRGYGLCAIAAAGGLGTALLLAR